MAGVAYAFYPFSQMSRAQPPPMQLVHDSTHRTGVVLGICLSLHRVPTLRWPPSSIAMPLAGQTVTGYTRLRLLLDFRKCRWPTFRPTSVTLREFIRGLSSVASLHLRQRALQRGRSFAVLMKALYTDSPLRARDTKVARQFFGGGGSSSSYKSFDPADELGVQDPVGFWDPLGLAADKNEATFKRRRSVELKHGRVAMAAAMGYITPEYYKFPGFLSPSLGIKFSDVPNGADPSIRLQASPR